MKFNHEMHVKQWNKIIDLLSAQMIATYDMEYTPRSIQQKAFIALHVNIDDYPFDYSYACDYAKRHTESNSCICNECPLIDFDCDDSKGIWRRFEDAIIDKDFYEAAKYAMKIRDAAVKDKAK
jgi:hypothetical protein